MLSYILRRVLYAIPILIGVNILTFLLFFYVNTPDQIARSQLGDKRISETAIQQWKADRGYDKPSLWNSQAQGLEKFSDTIFFDKSVRMMAFDFGISDSGRNISHDIQQRMWPSLAIAIPTLVIGLTFNITIALMLLFLRYTKLELVTMIACVALLSISSLFYIIGGQYLFSKILQLAPISGYTTGVDGLKFLVLPVIIGVIGGIGSGVRWYRTLFLEEVNKDYVRTARAKGMSEIAVLFKHLFRNALIPILTGVVVILPLLFMGSLVMESFFGIPGLGSYTIDGIQRQDFAIVRSMVYLGSVLYIIGLILTDISYTMVDPRVRLN